MKEEVSKLNKGDELIIDVLKDDSHFITFAIKSEELPVIYEEKDEGETVRFKLRLKNP